jgi:hypothetical protein
LEIDESEFQVNDFTQNTPKSLSPFDIVFCIEMAEHIPETKSENLVDFLCAHGDIVLFSAAVPGQGGVGHINEQNQSYWFDKFYARGFRCMDVIRPLIWDSSEVNVIYKQNMLLYVRDHVALPASVQKGGDNSREISTNFELDRIHPDLLRIRAFSAKASRLDRPIKFLKWVRRHLKRW